MTFFTLHNIGTLVLAIAIPMAGCIIGSTLGPGGDSAWYRKLSKPSWTPPNWAFPVVWTILYVLMGVASWLVWKEGGLHAQAIPLRVYVLQLIINLSWTPLFFGIHRIDIALGVVVLLWLAVAATIYFFFVAKHAAGYLLIPYIMWVTVAVALNGYIWKNNPLERGGSDITTPLRGGSGGPGMASA